ncbi:MAG: hypothetical protein NVS1B4_13110 [Gemmatimonadaceae bacterium]
MARRLGATDEQLTAIANGRFESFDAGWSAAFQFASSVTPTGGQVAAQVFDALAASWSPIQIVEITAVVGLFNYFNRFALALDVPVTR